MSIIKKIAKGTIEEKRLEKKRLLIATDSFLPRWDGVARFLLEMIPYLKKEFKITILAPDFGELNEEGFEDVRIIRFPTTKFQIADYNLPKPRWGVIKKEVEAHDVVWTQTLGPIGYLAMKYGRKKSKKVVAYIHSIEWELVSKGLTKNETFRKVILSIAKKAVKKLYNDADMLMVPSGGISNFLTEQGIRTDRKIIHLATNPEVFKPPLDKEEAKRELEMGGKIIGFCGRIGKEKNLDTLYKAYKLLKKHHPHLKLIFIADGPESQKEKFPEAIITGNTRPVPYLQALDVFILPSLTETTSLSTMEAMSTGLPVVVTKVGYVKDYVTDGINGLFTPKKNVRKMAEKIERLLTHSELRERLGQNARKTILNHYSWDKTAKRIVETLKKLS